MIGGLQEAPKTCSPEMSSKAYAGGHASFGAERLEESIFVCRGALLLLQGQGHHTVV